MSYPDFLLCFPEQTETTGEKKKSHSLPLKAFLLWLLSSGDGGGDGRQSRWDDVELIFF